MVHLVRISVLSGLRRSCLNKSFFLLFSLNCYDFLYNTPCLFEDFESRVSLLLVWIPPKVNEAKFNWRLNKFYSYDPEEKTHLKKWLPKCGNGAVKAER